MLLKLCTEQAIVTSIVIVSVSTSVAVSASTATGIEVQVIHDVVVVVERWYTLTKKGT